MKQTKPTTPPPLKELIFTEGLTPRQAIFKNKILERQTDFFDLYRLMRGETYVINGETIQTPLHERKERVKKIYTLKIEHFKNRLNTRTLSKDFHAFEDSDIILHGIYYGKFADIERNFYYTLDNIDFILNGRILTPFCAAFDTNPNIYEKLCDEIKAAKIEKIGTEHLEKHCKYSKFDPMQDKGAMTKIPLDDIAANTELLNALLMQRNTDQHGRHTSGFKYRDFALKLIGEYLHSNLLLMRHSLRPRFWSASYGEPTANYRNIVAKSRNQKIFDNNFIRKWILDIFLPTRAANYE